MVSQVRAQPTLNADDLELAIVRSVRGSPTDLGSQNSPEPPDDPQSARIEALVDLAKGGDSEAFGQLYDHYADQVFRYIYYRVGSRPLAEDLTADAFVRALRALPRFTWQGSDFGAWLTTIARNLITDHFKSSRTKREFVADEVPDSDDTRDGPEQEVLTNDANQALMDALRTLPDDQQECLVSRFLLERSIAETAALMDRSPGAIKQLQLRAIRTLAKTFPEGLR